MVTLKVHRIVREADRTLLFERQPGFHLIASADADVQVGDLIEFEPHGSNVGFVRTA